MNRLRDKHRWVALAVLGPLPLGACGSEPVSDGTADGRTSTETAPALQSDAATASLRSLRARHALPTTSAPQAPSLAHARPSAAPVLKRGRARFEPTAGGLRALFAEPNRPAAAELLLPATAADTFSVRDVASDIAIGAALEGARPVNAAAAEGLVVYAAATPDGATWIHRATETGTEDFLAFERRPLEAAIRYGIRLSPEVAGLRLVANTLEVLDAAGTPRLRVAPPSLRDADGRNVPAELDLAGCLVDRDPAAPWGRPTIPPGASECQLAVRWNEEVKYPALLDPTWSTTGSLATARAGASAVTLANGRVLVVGGVGADGVCLDSAELYDATTRTWAVTDNLETARCLHTATRRANGQVVVVGGVTALGEPTADTEIYNPSAGIWSAGQPLAAPRFAHRAALLNTGDVLVAGGSVTTAERLSGASSRWSRAGAPGAVTDHTLTVLQDGRALLVGGSQPQLFEPRTNAWLPVRGALSTYRAGHTATRLQSGQVLIVGADEPTTELYDPASSTFLRVGAASVRRYHHTATLLTDGRVLLAGGVSWDSAQLAAELYNPSWGTIAPTPAPPSLRVDHVDALLPNGRVLLAGGMDPATGETLAMAEEFEPRSSATTTSEYKFPAIIDPAVLDDRYTELWASVTRPVTLPAGKLPLLVFLHGNHGTCGTGNPRQDFSCEYTDTGTCPAGYVVTPNHRGYDYVAAELAARGYVVVSINANRGINCSFGTKDDSGLNLARGRLILKHLQTLSEWNRGVAPTPASIGVSLTGKLDFSQVGIMGHSRGGEGARAAYQQYRDAGSPWPARIVAPLAIRGIFEIGPVDGQTSRVLNAEGTTWNVLLPMCDGDVWDLQGVKPFDRMMGMTSERTGGFKSTYTVWGANHNFYNTEWKYSDSPGCTDHRPLFSDVAADYRAGEQRQTGLRSMYDFFVSNVGVKPVAELKDLFNPEKFVDFESPVERGYTPGESPDDSRMLEDFLMSSGTSSYRIRNVHSRVTVQHGQLPDHAEELRGATIRWTAGGPNSYFQTNFAQPGSGFDLSNHDLLDFRIGRALDSLNVQPSTSLYVQLVHADDSLSELVPVDAFGASIVGPVGGPFGSYHQMLQTVRIPLWSFGTKDFSAVRGVRFSFQLTPTGAIYLANVRSTRSTLVGSSVSLPRVAAGARSSAAATGATAGAPTARSAPATRRIRTGNSVSLRRAAGERVEVVLSSSTPFLARAKLLVLDIGGKRSVVARHPNGDLRTVVFTLNDAEFEELSSGASVRVLYEGGTGDEWDFGALDKSLLNQ